MAASRQPQLLHNFLHAVRSCKPTTYRSIRHSPAARAKLHTTPSNSQTTYPNRYGPAATGGLPPPPKPVESLVPKKEDVKSSEAQQSQPAQASIQPPKQQLLSEKQDEKQVKEDSEQSVEGIDISDHIPHPTPLEEAAAVVSAQQTSSDQPLPPELDPNVPLDNKELDIILSVPSPAEVQIQKSRHPHLEPSPYEHHFDTYSLVQDLAKDSDAYSEKQAITIMKAIRLMLSDNLELAKEGLISKSDIENESYLFRAACSELRTTLQMTRASENQKQRTQRASLQHEMDILNQKVTQDMQTMREDMKGLFNDRKMGLQEEKRKVDSKISELNYEITVLLNSEAKSEVEGLRWVLTRRAAIAIGAAAFMILSSLQYYTARSREIAEIGKKKAAAAKAQEDRIASESQARYTTPNRSSGTQTGITEYEESLG